MDEFVLMELRNDPISSKVYHVIGTGKEDFDEFLNDPLYAMLRLLFATMETTFRNIPRNWSCEEDHDCHTMITHTVQAMSAELCRRRGCDKLAKWNPVIQLFPDIPTGQRAVPARLTLGIAICDEHIVGNTYKDFLNLEAWPEIDNKFAANGMRPPKQEWTKVDYVPYNPAASGDNMPIQFAVPSTADWLLPKEGKYVN